MFSLGCTVLVRNGTKERGCVWCGTLRVSVLHARFIQAVNGFLESFGDRVIGVEE